MASPRPRPDLQVLMQRLGYAFTDTALLKRALTHKSCGQPHNEQLEFLGDSVVGLVVSSFLFDHHAELAEGDMSRWRSQLVNTDYLANTAQRLCLANYLSTQSTGSQRQIQKISRRMLANTMESIIGALYLDCGDWDTCCQLVTAWLDLEAQVQRSPEQLIDAKTALQQWCQARHIDLPAYKDIAQPGPQHFIVHCSIATDPIVQSEGEGKTKRQAQQQAASRCLDQLHPDNAG